MKINIDSYSYSHPSYYRITVESVFYMTLYGWFSEEARGSFQLSHTHELRFGNTYLRFYDKTESDTWTELKWK